MLVQVELAVNRAVLKGCVQTLQLILDCWNDEQ